MENFELNYEELDNRLIKNRELEKYIQFKLGKENFTLEDLDLITEIFLTSKTFSGELNLVLFQEITLFKNLEKIRFDNLGITPNVIEIISNSNAKNISFENCEIIDFNGLENIETLNISNCEIEDFSTISNLNNLKKLYFCFMTQKQLATLPSLENLEFLSIIGIDNFSIEDILKFKNLKYLSIGKQDSVQFKGILENTNLEIIIEDSYDEL